MENASAHSVTNFRLDLRAPVVVLSGILNPAIFNPPWIATHLLDHKEGDTFVVGIAIVPGPIAKTLSVIDQIGFSVTAERCELYLTSLNEDHIRRVEEVAKRIVQKLPHTPWGALGVNFQFTAAEDSDVADRISPTPENLEREFRVVRRVLKTEIELQRTRRLGIQRNIDESEFSVFFNDHHDDLDQEAVVEMINDKISSSLETARHIMRKYYDMSEEIVESFTSLPPDDEDKP